MVMPSWARPVITSSTSAIISGSRAEVGSSNSMTLGCMHSARAMAMRCCWPPDNCEGNLLAWSRILTLSSKPSARSMACASGTPRLEVCGSVQFFSTVRCGNRLKCWKHMPTCRRIRSRPLTLPLSSSPNTSTNPCWCCSSWLMQRIRVDLPEPEGPQITTFSPACTSREMFFNTWALPNHLFNCSMRTIAAASALGLLIMSGFAPYVVQGVGHSATVQNR